MGIGKLYDLKAKYEKELLFLQAKIDVINDLISIEETNKVSDDVTATV